MVPLPFVDVVLVGSGAVAFTMPLASDSVSEAVVDAICRKHLKSIDL